MPRPKSASKAPLQTTGVLRNDGTSLEGLTVEVLRLFPGASLEHQKKLVGKKIDVYCVMATGFMPAFRIALEC